MRIFKSYWIFCLLICSHLKAQTFPASPNVFIIIWDDVGWELSGEGSTYGQTPNLDAFKNAGWEFRYHLTAANSCAGTRYAIQHGKNMLRGALDAAHNAGDPIFDPNEFSLADLFHTKNYLCYSTGKCDAFGSLPDTVSYTNTGSPSATNPQADLSPYGFDEGWERQDGGSRRSAYSNFSQMKAWVNANNTGRPIYGLVGLHEMHNKMYPSSNWSGSPGPVTGNFPFKDATDKAFYLSKYASLVSQTTCPAPINPGASQGPNSSAGGATSAPWTYADYFYGGLESADKWFGQFLNDLTTAGIRNNSIIIVLSDNGFHGREEDSYGDNSPSWGNFSATKGKMRSGGNRTFCYMQWPAFQTANSVGHVVVNSMISSIDFMPTLAHLTNTYSSALDFCDGEDFTPVLTGTWQRKYGVMTIETINDAGQAGPIGEAPTGTNCVNPPDGNNKYATGHNTILSTSDRENRFRYVSADGNYSIVGDFECVLDKEMQTISGAYATNGTYTNKYQVLARVNKNANLIYDISNPLCSQEKVPINNTAIKTKMFNEASSYYEYLKVRVPAYLWNLPPQLYRCPTHNEY